MAIPLENVSHGLQRYRHRELKCRCEICREAWTDYMHSYRRNKRHNQNRKKAGLLHPLTICVLTPPHGIKRYRSKWYQCRCTICKTAKAAEMYAYRHKERTP